MKQAKLETDLTKAQRKAIAQLRAVRKKINAADRQRHRITEQLHKLEDRRGKLIDQLGYVPYWA